MKISNRQQGQTLIETALILSLLLVIVLGIEEFARAWYTKNSAKNAARQGARVAVVTPLTPLAPTTIDTTSTCSGANPLCNATRPSLDFIACPSGTGPITDPIINAICNSAGLPTGVDRIKTAYVTCFLNGPSSLTTLDSGDTVNICVRTDFTSAIPNDFPGLDNIIPNKLYGDASMRYE